MVWVLKDLSENSGSCMSGIEGVYETKMDAINDWWNNNYAGSEREVDYNEYVRLRDVLMEKDYDSQTELTLYEVGPVRSGIQLDCGYCGSDNTEDRSDDREDTEDNTSADTEDNREDTKDTTKPMTRSEQAGLLFPVGQIERNLREGRYANGGFDREAPIYLAAVLEYLTSEILELAGNEVKNDSMNNRIRIEPRHIQSAIRNDEELNRLIGNVSRSIPVIIPKAVSRSVQTNVQPRNIQPRNIQPSTFINPTQPPTLPPVILFSGDRYDQDGCRLDPADPTELGTLELPNLKQTKTELNNQN